MFIDDFLLDHDRCQVCHGHNQPVASFVAYVEHVGGFHKVVQRFMPLPLLAKFLKLDMEEVEQEQVTRNNDLQIMQGDQVSVTLADKPIPATVAEDNESIINPDILRSIQVEIEEMVLRSTKKVPNTVLKVEPAESVTSMSETEQPINLLVQEPSIEISAMGLKKDPEVEVRPFAEGESASDLDPTPEVVSVIKFPVTVEFFSGQKKKNNNRSRLIRAPKKQAGSTAVGVAAVGARADVPEFEDAAPDVFEENLATWTNSNPDEKSESGSILPESLGVPMNSSQDDSGSSFNQENFDQSLDSLSALTDQSMDHSDSLNGHLPPDHCHKSINRTPKSSEMLQCPECEYSSNHVSTIYTHSAYKHYHPQLAILKRNRVMMNEQGFCSECPYRSITDLSTYIHHIGAKHKRMRDFIPEGLVNAYESLPSKKAHIGYNKNSSQKSLECLLCPNGRSFANVTAYKQHLAINHYRHQIKDQYKKLYPDDWLKSSCYFCTKHGRRGPIKSLTTHLGSKHNMILDFFSPTLFQQLKHYNISKDY